MYLYIINSCRQLHWLVAVHVTLL
uniref:Uncharacterized protein n=1 Tax=Anguilla anguilla TaxID=7936 RepID=A0A0E9V3W9_ANGAN